MSTRHAYLIMAHHEPDILKTLLQLLDDPRNEIFLHIDKKSDVLRAADMQEVLHDSKLHLIPSMRICMVSCSASRERISIFAPSYSPSPTFVRKSICSLSVQIVLACTGPSDPYACVTMKFDGSLPRISKIVRSLIASRNVPNCANPINASPSHVGCLITPPPISGVSGSPVQSNGSYALE